MNSEAIAVDTDFGRADAASRTGRVTGVDLPSIRWKSLELERLDRLHWAAGACLTIFGTRIGIRVNACEFLDPLIKRLPLGWEVAHSTKVERLYSAILGNAEFAPERRHRNFLFANGHQLGNAMKLEDLYEAFESDLDFYVGRASCARLFVHAGVVAWKGRGIIIPGESHSGKTTLVRALLEAGATYYSDEFSVFDSDGRVHPFPRRLSVRSEGAATKIAPDQFGAQTGNTPVAVGLVVLTRYQPGAHWCPKVMSPGDGMLGLIKNTLAARRYPALTLTTLGNAICEADVVGGTRGEANEIALWVAQHLDR